jgi:hypothetical protein
VSKNKLRIRFLVFIGVPFQTVFSRGLISASPNTDEHRTGICKWPGLMVRNGDEARMIEEGKKTGTTMSDREMVAARWSRQDWAETPDASRLEYSRVKPNPGVF